MATALIFLKMINQYFPFLLPLFATLFFSVLSAIFYYKYNLKRDIASSTVIFSVLVFFIVYFVSFENNIGLGIGLLGILSLIRLRSTPENLTDIGLIFYAISLGLLNASIIDIYTVLIVDTLSSLVLFALYSGMIFKKRITSMKIVFDDLNFEEKHSMTKIKERVKKDHGILPIYAHISKIDHLKDTVTVNILYVLD